MQIEYIARIGFATGWLSGEQREFAMGRGMLGQIVEDDQRVLAAIAKILGYGEARERRDPLQSRRCRRRGNDKDAALGGAVLLHGFDDSTDRGRALADRYVDADQVRVLLIDNRIKPDCRLAGGTITDDQLALATANREQGVDDQNPGLQRLGDEIALDDGGCRGADWAFLFCRFRARARRGSPVARGPTARRHPPPP